MCEISVVIPVYNKSSYIRNTIKCILNQSFSDFELILIDDGSTDDSGTICDDMADSDSRVHIIHTPNKGVSAARNTGINMASGKYICFPDADDIVHIDYLKLLYEAIISGQYDVAVCDYFELNGTRRIRHGLLANAISNELYEIIKYDMLCVLWNKLFVKDKIKHYFDESITNCEDTIFCARYYIDNSPGIAWVNEALYEYRKNENSLSTSYQGNIVAGADKMLFYFRKLALGIDNQDMRRQALLHILKVYHYAIYTYIFENVAKNNCKVPPQHIADKEHKIDEAAIVIREVINSARYQKVVKTIMRMLISEAIRVRSCNKKLLKNKEKLSGKEFLYLIFSILKMDRAVYMTAKVKLWLKDLRNHL